MSMPHRNRAGTILVLLCAASSVARADDASALAAAATFTPGMLAADGSAGFAVAATQWDGARHATALNARLDVPVFGPLHVIARVDDLATHGRPGAGLGVRLLDEQRHGVAASAYALYKTEGFTETEGELEATFALGKQLGAARTTLDLTYGQDFDGHARDGEVAAAVLVEPVHNWFAGVTARFRDALGSGGDHGVLRDFVGGPTVTFAYRMIAVTAVAGVAGATTTTSSYGPAGSVAIGSAF
ncbi:hypothetical protein BH11MYX1_BH11MYX1_41490 [soil metagenome]